MCLGLVLAACRSAYSDPASETAPASEPAAAVDAPPGAIRIDAPVTIEEVATGLVNPVGLAALPDGRVLIAEEGSGEDDASAGVSLLSVDGTVRRVISGLPSGRDSGDLSGVPLVGVSPDGNTVYTAHFGAGSLLTVSADRLQVGEPLGPGDLGAAMRPLNNVTLTNPFDITFDEDGIPVVSDASQNGVATENPDGTTRFIHRFGALADPTDPRLSIDPVPTGITRLESEYLVTLTGGCPYPAGAGRLVAVDDARNQRTVAAGLNMPIDVTVDAHGTIWLLEFAQFEEGASCFTGTGYMEGTGRLSRLGADGRQEIVVDRGLSFPGAVLATGDGLLITEVFTGRVLRVSLGPEGLNDTQAAPRFVDATTELGISFRHGAFPEEISADPAAMMGAGLCWIDYDRDGWLDLYLVNSHAAADVAYWEANGGLPTNALYRNDRGAFTDVSADTNTGVAVRGNGCLAADFDLDGWTDLYITADGDDVVLRNAGDGTFVDVSAAVDAPEWNTAAVAGDLNGDGYPEVFIGSYIDLGRKIAKPSGAFPQDYVGIPDRLFLNESTPGQIRFRDVGAEAGLLHDERALGALFTDLDLDGDLDLYIANDGQANRLYENSDDPGLGFVLSDVTASSDVGDTGSGMGVAGGDYDGNGAFDLFVTNWEAELNALYRNEQPGSLDFLYATHRVGIAGLGNNKTAWGASWADFDHDTDLDLLVAHGRVPVSSFETDPELMRFYANLSAQGSAGQLRDRTPVVGLDVVGPLLARGSAVADFDNDGDLDVAVNTIGGPAHLLRNDLASGNWLQLAGLPPGSRVTVRLADGADLVRERHAGSSYLATEDSRIHVGLGRDETVDVTVRFPDGSTATLIDVAVNQIVQPRPP